MGGREGEKGEEREGKGNIGMVVERRGEIRKIRQGIREKKNVEGREQEGM